MDCRSEVCTLQLVMLTIFVLGPSLVEFIQQSFIRNIRGIKDVIVL